MTNTYYDSQLTAAEIEAALEAVDGLIVPANNGKIIAVEDGTLVAKSVTEYTETAVLEPLSVTENGDYTPSAGVDGFSDVHVAVPSSQPTLQSKTVTPGANQQTVQPDSGYDGLSSVVVNGDADLVAGNIKKNVEIFGVTGSYEGSGGGSTLITKTITQNGTYNASSDNADGYSQVTVNVSGGGSSNALEIDFTRYPVGTAITLNSNSGVIIGSDGAIFDSTTDYITIPISGPLTVELDVAEMNLQSGSHRRFIMAGSSVGLIYRSNGKWSFYSGSSWATDSDIADGDYFDGHTIKVIIDTNGYWHIYRDNTLVYEPENAVPLTGFIMIGSSSSSINNAVISKVRVYY